MKKIWLSLLVAMSAFTLSGCSFSPAQAPTVEQEQNSRQTLEVSPEESTDSGHVFEQSSTQHQLLLTATADGQTAFELLQSEAEVEYKEYDFGIFIESINGTKADDQHYWAVYVNGEYAQTGTDQIQLHQGDQVLFTYEQL